MIMILKDSSLSVDKTAESILKRRTLNSASPNVFLMSSEKEKIRSLVVFPSENIQPRLSSVVQFFIDVQMPSSSDVEHDKSLTSISMRMSESSFDELWSKEDDSYWDSY